MSQSPKEKITDVETVEHRREREKNRRVFLDVSGASSSLFWP